MPLIPCKPGDISTVYVLTWEFIPNEELDFSKFSHITTLTLSAVAPTTPTTTISNQSEDDDTKTEPYMIPSFANLFPNVRQLYIKNWTFANRNCFIGGLTDVPDTIEEVTLDDTYITDLCPILSLGKNICSLTIRDNLTPISMGHSFPDKLSVFILYRTIIMDALIFPECITRIVGVDSTIPRMNGLDRAMLLSTMKCSFRDCITPYNTNIIGWDDLSKGNLKVQHITRVNAEDTYQQFGSIPKRIRISTEEDLDNPIIIAMNLASNYPRRMAEFISETPKIEDTIIWADYYAAYEDNDDEDDDEDNDY